MFGVLSAPKIIHPVSALVLSVGVASLARRAARRHESVASALARRAWAVPVIPASIWLGTTAALALAGGSPANSGAASGTLNVILVVFDTVRRDHFSWSGARSYTPNIDRLAARGIVYEDAWSVSSWSLPTQASILTGSSPERHLADWPALALSRDATTLGEYFVRRGYRTAAFSSNSSWITPEYLGRGFQSFDVYTYEDHFRRTAYGRFLNRLSRFAGFHYAGRGREAAELNGRLIEFVRGSERPFFAYVCYMDVNRAFHRAKLGHPFWERTPALATQIDAYRQGLTALDAELGRLIAELERSGMMEKTLIVITSDHGESFGTGHESDQYPAGHGTSLYPEQVRVPLLVIPPPGQVQPGHVKATVSLKSIAATISALTGGSPLSFPNPPLPTPSPSDSSASARRFAVSSLQYEDRDWIGLAMNGWEYVENRAGRDVRDTIVAAPVRGVTPALRPTIELMRARASALLTMGSRTTN
jgi:arylsulfatase A-like enzyme